MSDRSCSWSRLPCEGFKRTRQSIGTIPKRSNRKAQVNKNGPRKGNNMSNGYYTRENLEAILESLEQDEAADERDEEASRSRSRGRTGSPGRTGPRTASDGGSYRAPV